MTHSLRDLLRPKRFYSVQEVLADPSIVPAVSGIYGWWFADQLPGVPLEDTVTTGGWRLLYVGIAPRAPTSEEGPRRNLRDRLKNHCRGPMATSTLRRTLASLIASDLALQISTTPAGKLTMSKADEDRLTEWLNAHARVAWMTHDAPWEVEEAALRQIQLTLNIRGATGKFRHELQMLRKTAPRPA